MGPTQRPLHLLLLDQLFCDDLVDRRLHEGRADRFLRRRRLPKFGNELAVICRRTFKELIEVVFMTFFEECFK